MESLGGYLRDLASEAPAPGGGSAAMIVGAAGCALVAMVARICAASRKYAAVLEPAQRLIAGADALRARFEELRVSDEAAFNGVVAARGNADAMQRALAKAAAVPLEGARNALEALELAKQGLALGNRNLASDLGCAAEFAYAALNACAYNVRVNHKFMKDADLVRTQAEELHAAESRAFALKEETRSAVFASLSH